MVGQLGCTISCYGTFELFDYNEIDLLYETFFIIEHFIKTWSSVEYWRNTIWDITEIVETHIILLNVLFSHINFINRFDNMSDWNQLIKQSSIYVNCNGDS